MNTVVARVLRVLVGHSPTAMIHARSEEHEFKIEAAAAVVRNVSPGQVLVLQWSVHGLPELAAGEVVEGATAPPGNTTPTPANIAEPPAAPASASRSSERELEVMLGLQPGRLQSI